MFLADKTQRAFHFWYLSIKVCLNFYYMSSLMTADVLRRSKNVIPYRWSVFVLNLVRGPNPDTDGMTGSTHFLIYYMSKVYWTILYSDLKYKIKLLLRPIVDPKVRTREKHVRPIRNKILWDIPCYLRSWIQGHQDAILLHNTRFIPLPWGICKQIREKTYSFLGPSH